MACMNFQAGFSPNGTSILSSGFLKSGTKKIFMKGGSHYVEWNCKMV